MPKLKGSARARMDRAFLAALRYGQTMWGEKDPDMFTRGELRVLIPRYFNDRQLCDAFGVEYHGSTPN